MKPLGLVAMLEARDFLKKSDHDTDCPVAMGVVGWRCECGLVVARRIIASLLRPGAGVARKAIGYSFGRKIP